MPEAVDFLTGTMAGWLTIAVVVITAWVLWRGGGGTALRTLSDANRILERRVHDLERQVKADQELIAQLRAQTDITEALRPLIEAVLIHEKHADERFQKTITALDVIAGRFEVVAGTRKPPQRRT